MTIWKPAKNSAVLSCTRSVSACTGTRGLSRWMAGTAALALCHMHTRTHTQRKPTSKNTRDAGATNVQADVPLRDKELGAQVVLGHGIGIEHGQRADASQHQVLGHLVGQRAHVDQ